jgi:hypothetical protein
MLISFLQPYMFLASLAHDDVSSPYMTSSRTMAFQSFIPFNFIPDPPNLPAPIPNPQVVWENKASLTRHRDTYPFIDPYRFQNALREKVAIITLAHRGIGKATALAFAQAGASVCSSSNSST